MSGRLSWERLSERAFLSPGYHPGRGIQGLSSFTGHVYIDLPQANFAVLRHKRSYRLPIGRNNSIINLATFRGPPSSSSPWNGRLASTGPLNGERRVLLAIEQSIYSCRGQLRLQLIIQPGWGVNETRARFRRVVRRTRFSRRKRHAVFTITSVI